MKRHGWPSLLASCVGMAVLATAPASAQESKGDSAAANLPALEGPSSPLTAIPDSLRRRKTPPPPERTGRAVAHEPELLNGEEVSRAISNAYPTALREQNITGSVTLRFRVNEDGTADLPSLQTRGATHPAFAEAAAKVLPMMRFRPATVGGRPFRAWVTLPVNFLLDAAIPVPRISR